MFVNIAAGDDKFVKRGVWCYIYDQGSLLPLVSSKVTKYAKIPFLR